MCSEEQLNRLNSIGFSWNPLDERWEKFFASLNDFKKSNGHCRVSQKYKHGLLNLGTWIATQRKNKGELSLAQVERLDSIGFIWDPIAAQWEEAFEALKAFHKREGHCRVPIKIKTDGLKLGIWASNIRKRKDKLTPRQIDQLDSISFCWDHDAAQWEEAFDALKAFHKHEGHCKVAQLFSTNGLKLGSWVARQRQTRNSLSADKISRLNQLGFIWDPFAEQWEEAFEALKIFHKREGHCRVVAQSVINGFRLGSWVSLQRSKKSQLSADQIDRLDSLGFTWDPHAQLWEESFLALQKFRKREGHCRVSQSFEADGVKLGAWVSKQRQKKSSLSPDRIKRLNSLGFIWKP